MTCEHMPTENDFLVPQTWSKPNKQAISEVSHSNYLETITPYINHQYDTKPVHLACFFKLF